jgi:uncharacterized lipoprotein YddW (UPF0748 family)
MPLLRRLALPFVLALLALLPAIACGQSPPVPPPPRLPVDSAPPPIPREFRAAWVASVENIDWPSRKGLTTWEQQAEMLAILDKLVQLHMNAIVLQVRPAADALYQSSIEPWSDFLTGVMGRAPEPYYDPLAFAIAEAHKRGLEMHVWINPYRAKDPATTTVSANHISRTRPELVRKYGPFLWLDPGDPAVRALTTSVVLDLVRRYDVDGVHMDDYFYPYPEARNGRELDFPDEPTWTRYRRGGGTLSRDDWRRENVNLLVKGLYDGIHAVKPWVRFGVSPFGIWRPGYPASVRGLDQYSRLYADARKWLQEGWVDYFTPQLYWAVNRPEQSYPVLLRWWSEQNVKGRNLWPGNYTGKVAFTNASAWRTDEVLEQIRLTRAQPGATGNVHFSMKVFLQDPDSLDERLVREVYSGPALVPASPWLDRRIPVRPIAAVRVDSISGDRVLDLRPGIEGVATTATGPVNVVRVPWLWVVQTRADSAWSTTVLPGSESRHVLGVRGAAPVADVWVTAVDRVGNASPAVRAAPPAL